MPTERIVQVAPNSTGEKIRNFGVNPGAGEVLMQVVALADPDIVARVLALLITQPALAAVAVPCRPIPFRPGISAVTRVGASVTDIELVAANASRIGGVVLFNDSSARLTLRLGSGAATPTDFTTKLDRNQHYETPPWTGAIHGLWASAVGAVQVTQLTP